MAEESTMSFRRLEQQRDELLAVLREYVESDFRKRGSTSSAEQHNARLDRATAAIAAAEKDT